MKKLLSLLSASILTLTGVGSVVSCSQKKTITAYEELREELEQNTTILFKILEKTMATFQAYWDKNTNISVAKNDNGFNRLLEKVEDNQHLGPIEIKNDELSNYGLLNDIYSNFKTLFDNTNQKLLREYSNYFGNQEPLNMDETNPFFTGNFINFKEISDITQQPEDNIKAISIVYNVKWNIGFKSNKITPTMNGTMLMTDKPNRMKEIAELVTEKVRDYLETEFKRGDSIIAEDNGIFNIFGTNDYLIPHFLDGTIKIIIGKKFKTATYVKNTNMTSKILELNHVSYYGYSDTWKIPSILSFHKKEGLLPDTFSDNDFAKLYKQELEKNLQKRHDFSSLPPIEDEFHWGSFNLVFKNFLISGLPLANLKKVFYLKMKNDYLETMIKSFATQVVEFYRTFQIESYKTKLIFSLPKDLYNKLGNSISAASIGRLMVNDFRKKVNKDNKKSILYLERDVIKRINNVEGEHIFSFNWGLDAPLQLDFGAGMKISLFQAERGSKYNIVEYKRVD